MTSTASAPAPSVAPSRVLRVVAFAAIYLIWGASFLAIRIVVARVPPLLAAGVRFVIAGLALFLWSAARGTALPTLRQWRSAALVGVGMFACNYGPVFWAEQRVSSGVTAIIASLIPVWVAALECMRSARRVSARLLLGTAWGLAGVVSLSFTPQQITGQRIAPVALCALLFSTFAWAGGTVWSQRLPLPAAKPMSASIQMLLGGVAMLMVSLALGELPKFHVNAINRRVIFSMLYLILGASILAFTAYIWLLGHEPSTRVASYAYVNPVVAVMLGWALGGETLSLQVILGMVLVLAGVVTVLGERKTSAHG